MKKMLIFLCPRIIIVLIELLNAIYEYCFLIADQETKLCSTEKMFYVGCCRHSSSITKALKYIVC